MTTIAWDGKTLAADSLATQEDKRVSHVAKIGVVGSGVVRTADPWLWAFVGCAAYRDEFVAWVENGCSKHHLPPMHGHENSATGLVIKKGGLILELSHDLPLDTYTPIGNLAAWGSGGELALGAMLAGADAPFAVECAMKRDTLTGGDIMKFSHA